MTDHPLTRRSPVPERGFAAFAPPREAVLRLRPLGWLVGADAAREIAAGRALPLAGGPRLFTHIEMLARGAEGETLSALGSLAELGDWARQDRQREAQVHAALDRLTEERPRWAGFALDRPLLMGVVNVTPDSFSDGGAFLDPAAAIAHGHALLEAGADLLDIGGESTRPGAGPVDPAEELRRTLPVIKALAAAGAALSIDTRHAAVMEAALSAGARIVNDVSALTAEPESLGVVARAGAAVVLMHMAGEPRTMQTMPRYRDVALDLLDYLEARLGACAQAGIPAGRVVLDPGIGFGKTLEHNLRLLGRLSLFQGLGTGVAVGVSRKSFIAKASRGEAAANRLAGSLAAALMALEQGVQILRVHDVAETRQALTIRARVEASS